MGCEWRGGEAHVPVSSTDELDPSLAGGFRVIYDRETPFELRIQDADNTPQQIGTLEAIKVKILILKKKHLLMVLKCCIGSDTDIHVVRVELSTESDLFFLYTRTRATWRVSTRCRSSRSSWWTSLTTLTASQPPRSVPHAGGWSSATGLYPNMEYKFIELLSVDFTRASEDTIRQHITFRYTSMKSRLQVLQTRLHEVNSIVKTKNPSLLLQKTVPSPSSRNRYLMH
ncbi:hypothetical protein GQ600_10554 [Phytophthora cactorum]|nr:hypothetical protein GQ600_10554 [Phytophthora cactorum]